MRSSALSVSLAVVAAAATASAQNSTEPVGCASGLYILVARGSTEDPGPGVFGEVAQDIADKIPGAVVGALDYPATFQDYDDSVTDGTKSLRRALDDYHTNCPDGKIALMGYSQGAHVITLGLCEGSQTTVLTQNHTLGSTLQSDVVDKIVAVAQIGDPSHTLELNFNDGTSEHEGVR
jgi:acetylxylan esterase